MIEAQNRGSSDVIGRQCSPHSIVILLLQQIQPIQRTQRTLSLTKEFKGA